MKIGICKVTYAVSVCAAAVIMIASCGGGNDSATIGTPHTIEKVVYANADTTTKAKVYLGGADSFTVSNSGATVYGSSGNDTVTIAAGISAVTVDQNIETIIFSGASGDYTFRQTGNKINIHDSTGAMLIATVPIQGDIDGTVLSFINGKASALLANGIMTLGKAPVSTSTTPSPITSLEVTAAITPPSTTTKAKVYLGSADNFTVSNSGATVYGSSGNDTVTIAADISAVVLDQNIETIIFPGASSDYAFRQTGNKINIYNGTGVLLLANAPVQGDSDGTVLGFSNGYASALLSSGIMKLGGAIVSPDAPTKLAIVTTVDIPTTTTTTTTTTVATTTTTTTIPGVYSGKTTQASLVSVVAGVTSTNDFVPSCSASTVTPKVVAYTIGTMPQAVVAKQVAKVTSPSLPGIPTTSYNSYAIPRAGSCGGTIAIPPSSFSHSSGTSRGTFVYTNYCNYNSGSSGPREIRDGSATFVSNGTPGASGPVISSYTGTIPKLTVTGKDADGAVTSTTVMEGGGFTLTPDVYVNTIDMAKVVVTQGTKATMLTDLKVTATHSAASTTASITTKAYLGDVGYIDISTKTPLSFDSAGKYTAGTLTLTGTEGAVDISIDATATNGPVFIIPGSSKKLNCSAL